MASIVLPLSCLRSLNSLRFAAVASIIFVFFLSGVITLYALVPGLDQCAGRAADCRGDTTNFKMTTGTLKVLSIFVFGFTCHQNIFAACNEISDFSMKRVDKVIYLCIGITGAVYLFIAYSAYSTYGDKLSSNILKNYPDNAVLGVVRLLIATKFSFSYPLQLHPCRTSLSLLIHQWEHRKELAHGKVPAHDPSSTRLSILTAVLCGATFLIAMSVTELGVVQSLVGATGSTLISYILPGYVFLKLHPGAWTGKHYGAATLVAVGCVFIPSCLTFIFL